MLFIPIPFPSRRFGTAHKYEGKPKRVKARSHSVEPGYGSAPELARSCAPGKRPGAPTIPPPRCPTRRTLVPGAGFVDSQPCLRWPCSPPTAGLSLRPLPKPSDRGAWRSPPRRPSLGASLSSQAALSRSAGPRPSPLPAGPPPAALLPSSPFHLPRLLRPSLQPRPTPSSSPPGALRALRSGHSTPHAGLSAEGKGAEEATEAKPGPEAPGRRGKVRRRAAAAAPPHVHTGHSAPARSCRQPDPPPRCDLSPRPLSAPARPPRRAQPQCSVLRALPPPPPGLPLWARAGPAEGWLRPPFATLPPSSLGRLRR